MEYRLRRHDGVYRWILDRGTPFSDESDAFAGYIGSCVDVDERRQSQDTQQRRADEQRALARYFEKWILAILSHDIRDPLNSIQLAAHGLRKLPDPSGTLNNSLEIVKRGVGRIDSIIGDLLDLSRERDGAGIAVEPRSMDLSAACQQIIHELSPIARDRHITLDCQADSRGWWDAHRIVQAISNLVANAVQHSPPGSDVAILITGDELHAVVEIQNEGTIPAQLLPHIFDPFRSAREHAHRGEGLGLGLFIAQAIARAHRGEVEVASSEAVTRFRLVLPRKAP